MGESIKKDGKRRGRGNLRAEENWDRYLELADGGTENESKSSQQMREKREPAETPAKKSRGIILTHFKKAGRDVKQ